ncbi:hypothetical protein O181_031687 [Austropuccinia psidii MF-1]|uniref:Uncharacterized protein n=1 Tax=Austropuccinia psidii MF-1 TaxID=1389203 RepID=A0A9Q3D152_9BASI|nr:hypothetical protein [Austropuccinia psidii MF-1]
MTQGNVLRVKPIQRRSHKDITRLVEKLVQRSQGRRMGNMPKTLAGGYELILTHKELSGSGEGYIAIRRLKPIFFQGKGQKDQDLVKAKILVLVDQKKELEMSPGVEKKGPLVSTSSRTPQRQAQRTSE